MPENKLTFEEAYAKLEQIAAKLSGNEVTLDETIALYEEGIRLSKFCAEALENAKQKIEVLENE